MKVLDLFSGVGGFSLGLERAGMETIAFCEKDKKAQLVLKKHWPDVPIYEDVKDLNYERLKQDGLVADPHRKSGQIRRHDKADAGKSACRGNHQGRSGTDDFGKPGTQKNATDEKTRKQPSTIELICGGFPCQPFSVAGKQRGQADDRHLWPEYFRLIQEIRPRWVIGENVAGIINMGFNQVLSNLESENYRCQTLIIPACAINAPHRRDRVWFIAHHDNYGSCQKERDAAKQIGNQPQDRLFKQNGDVPDTKTIGIQRGGAIGKQKPQIHVGKTIFRGNGSRTGTNHWTTEPGVGRVANGVPGRVDRLKQLGNAVVPQIVEIIGLAIMNADKMEMT